MIEQTLEKIVAYPERHASWLNSLSYLEYRGFRKIVKSQPTQDMDLELLLHTAEEVRHALFFKKLALRIGGPKFSHYHEATLLAPAALKSYFYDLDHGSNHLIREFHPATARPIYFAVTLLIELRAVGVYEIYQDVLSRSGADISLAPVLRDEERHLSDVLSGVRQQFTHWEQIESTLKSLEEKCFQAVWQGIEASLA